MLNQTWFQTQKTEGDSEISKGALEKSRCNV